MKASPARSAVLVLPLLAIDCVSAVSFHGARSGHGYLAVSVGTSPRSRSQSKRDAFDTTLTNEDYFYSTNVSIGSNNQIVTVLVDTGSSELWVNPDCDQVTTLQDYRQCVTFGQYDPDDSDSAVGPFGSEVINYGDASDPSTQSSVNLTYYADDIALGDAQLSNQTFGVVVYSEEQSQGILGLSPDLQSGFDDDDGYSLILNTMYEQDLINSRAYALDLRHFESDTGAVIYGGLDRNKFVGELAARPIIRGEGGEYRMATSLTGMGVTSGGESRSYDLDDSDQNVVLDSGTTISRMHYSAAYPILQALGAQDDGEGYFVVLCSMQEDEGSVDFQFGGKTIRVPLSDFILNLGSDRYCYVGMVVTEDQQIIGDSVLRAGYFVFDWDNRQVHIAQAATCGDEDIVTISSGSDAVPSVTGNCQSSDAMPSSATGTPSSITSGNLPSSAFTTTFTVTSCPDFDLECSTGQIATATFGSVDATATTSSSGSSQTTDSSGSGDGDDDDDGEGAGSHLQMSSIAVMFGSLLVGAMHVF